MMKHLKIFEDFDVNEYVHGTSSVSTGDSTTSAVSDLLYGKLPKVLGSKFKGLLSKEEPPKYKPSDFKKDDYIYHEDYGDGKEPLKVLRKIDHTDDFMGGIEVEYEGKPVKLYYDTEKLRKDKDVGRDFYKIKGKKKEKENEE